MKFPLGLYRVAGESMLPTLKPGQLVIGWRWFKPRVGDIVVVASGRKLIKRISAVEGDQLRVIGDNAAASTDSRQFGAVEQSALIARIILKKSPLTARI